MKKRLACGILAASMLFTTLAPVALGAGLTNPLHMSARARNISPDTDIMVNEDTFPDAAFRRWILDSANLDGAGSDRILTAEERMQVKKMDVSGLGIERLAGIEAFHALETLDASYNRLTALDVSKNPALQTLNCASNQLESLIFAQNSRLTRLHVKYNRLTTLDLSNQPGLLHVNGEYNYLTDLDLSGSTALEWLAVGNNQLFTLDVSENGNLKFLDAFANRLTAIDVSMLPKLEFLHVGDNQLTHLDVGGAHHFDSKSNGFSASYNMLETLVLPNQPGMAIQPDAYAEQSQIEGQDRVEWYLDEQYLQKVEGGLPAEGQTLYAKRIPNTYRIYFAANYGNGSMPVTQAVYGEALELPAAAFTRYGHTFRGWNTSQRGNGDAYADRATVFNLAGKSNDERVTLYAQWDPISYNIAFDAGNDGAAGDMEMQTAVYNGEITLSANQFVLDGKEFAGWSREKDGPLRYRDGATVQNLSAAAGDTVTLYAVWRTPVDEVRKPYLEKLEQAFQTYSAESYTEEDWSVLTDSYLTAQQAVRATELSEQMEQAYQQGVVEMGDVLTKPERKEEIVGGWKETHRNVTGLLERATLNENSYAAALEQAHAALTELTAEQMGQYSGLTQEADREQAVGDALEELQPTAEKLAELAEAAVWVHTLGGMTTRPHSAVKSADFEAYRSKQTEYELLAEGHKAYIDTQVITGLAERRELADQKRIAVFALQSQYDGYRAEDYTQQGQEALKQALENGIALVEESVSAGEIQTAVSESRGQMEQVPQGGQEPLPPIDDEEDAATDGGSDGNGTGGGSSSGGGNNGGGTGSGTGGGSNGGGTTVTQYTVTADSAKHGTVTTNLTRAAKGDVVTINIAPDEGYFLDILTVSDRNGNRIALASKGNGKFTFVMPGAAVTISAGFREKEADMAWDHSFTDILADGWYYGAVAAVVKHDLFQGTSLACFEPDGEMTRAMLVTVLHRLAGAPDITNAALENPFADVDADSWYSKAVYWARQAGITTGTDDENFAPESRITREQLATMLYRYAGNPATEGSLDDFTDADQVGQYAADALRWAAENGIMQGKGQAELDPKGMATRAQVAKMIVNFV